MILVLGITLRSPASVPRRRREVLAAAVPFKAASRDEFLKHRARQVQQLVIRRADKSTRPQPLGWEWDAEEHPVISANVTSKKLVERPRNALDLRIVRD